MPHTQILSRTSRGTQQTLLFIALPSGVFRVTEELQGPDVRFAYGSDCHVHYLVLAPAAAAALLQFCGARDFSTALRQFFAPEHAVLGDLMDWLDKEALPYDYAVLTGDTLVYRRSNARA